MEKIIKLTTPDSEVSLTAKIVDGQFKYFVDDVEMDSFEQIANRIQTTVDEIKYEFWLRRVYPQIYLRETQLICDYAGEYWEAAAELSNIQQYRFPVFFLLGHAYELALKALIVYYSKKSLKGVINEEEFKPGQKHNLTKLRKRVNEYNAFSKIKTSVDESLVISFNKLYSLKIGDSSYFLKYPDYSHLSQKWPENFFESINPIADESKQIILFLNEELGKHEIMHRVHKLNSIVWPIYESK